jgi:recombination protein RecA
LSQITRWFVAEINIETMEKEREAKLKALQLTMDKLEKTYGKGSVMKMGDVVAEDIACIPTGSLGLDLALGIGGYPKGRVVEIYGPESSGKTTLAIHAMAEAQKAGGIAAFIDAEHAFDRFYAENLGVNIFTDAGVTKVIVSNGGTTGIQLETITLVTPASVKIFTPKFSA